MSDMSLIRRWETDDGDVTIWKGRRGKYFVGLDRYALGDPSHGIGNYYPSSTGENVLVTESLDQAYGHAYSILASLRGN